MQTEALEYQHHFGAATQRHFTHGLTDLINNLCAPKRTMMQLIHIKTEAEYNVLMKAFELKGYKPFEIGAGFQGERWYENTNQYLAYRAYDWNVGNGRNEIVEFEQFIKEAI